jgi:hypothetical protein
MEQYPCTEFLRYPLRKRPLPRRTLIAYVSFASRIGAASPVEAAFPLSVSRYRDEDARQKPCRDSEYLEYEKLDESESF